MTELDLAGFLDVAISAGLAITLVMGALWRIYKAIGAVLEGQERTNEHLTRINGRIGSLEARTSVLELQQAWMRGRTGEPAPEGE